MSHVPSFHEIELLKEAAEMPVLSAGFRERVLALSREQRRRRTSGRRMLWAAGLLIASLAIATWHSPLLFVGSQLAGLGNSAAAGESARQPAQTLNVSRRYGRGELLISAGGDDWRLVEAEMQSRQEGSRHIQLSF